MHIKQSKKKKKKEKSGEFFESFVCECVLIFDSGDFGLDWKRVLVRTFYEGGFLIVFFACLLACWRGERDAVIKVATGRFGFPNGLTAVNLALSGRFEGPREGTARSLTMNLFLLRGYCAEFQR